MVSKEKEKRQDLLKIYKNKQKVGGFNPSTIATHMLFF